MTAAWLSQRESALARLLLFEKTVGECQPSARRLQASRLLLVRNLSGREGPKCLRGTPSGPRSSGAQGRLQLHEAFLVTHLCFGTAACSTNSIKRARHLHLKV